MDKPLRDGAAQGFDCSERAARRWKRVSAGIAAGVVVLVGVIAGTQVITAQPEPAPPGPPSPILRVGRYHYINVGMITHVEVEPGPPLVGGAGGPAAPGGAVEAPGPRIVEVRPPAGAEAAAPVARGKARGRGSLMVYFAGGGAREALRLDGADADALLAWLDARSRHPAR